jgi:hypothetical protein
MVAKVKDWVAGKMDKLMSKSKQPREKRSDKFGISKASVISLSSIFRLIFLVILKWFYQLKIKINNNWGMVLF